MAANIWIVIGDNSKVKIVSFQHSIYQQENAQTSELGQQTKQQQGKRRRQKHKTRYEYQVIRQFNIPRGVRAGAPVSDKAKKTEDPEEPSTTNLLLSDDPEMAGLAAKLSIYLSKSKLGEKFDHLILVAPKEVLTVIKSALTPQLQELVTMELDTELMDADPETLRANLPANV